MITLVNEAITAGVSTSQSVAPDNDSGHTEHSVQITTNGSPTSVTVSLEGSIDGNNFACIARHSMSVDELDHGVAMFHIVSKAVPIVRANIIEIEGGVSPTVSMYYFKGLINY